jgi:hypothetical protein
MSFEDLDRIMKEDEKARHREVALTRPQNLLNLIGSSLNFYRVHLLVFTFVSEFRGPLANGQVFSS